MIPLRIEGADRIMRGNAPDVRDLHIKRIDGCFVSRWEPTPAELEMLNRGGSVEVWIMGAAHPPIMIQTSALASAPTQGGEG
ncbi:hypothetical protein AA101099_1809 [Neoasaia chiangmaiensis NBRC 101099]|nr:hypothetical protein AA101099_1809 [Neoasaia chiangmaiensis NBRC 101099]GEN14732.1 hypothetical protein NCH01_11630 [Neoasaia chiangmaiensis]